jgi:cephalosporin-C deacetylase-like acetyl esterase
VQSSQQAVPPFEQLVGLFDYDHKVPIDVKSTMVRETAELELRDITYASPAGGRVTAYLVTPRGKGPFPAVLFGHWGYGTRTEFLPEALLYARTGVVSLLVDYPWVRPAPWRRALTNFADGNADRRSYVHAVVDLRRGLDLLASHPLVDASRLGYIGHSYGGQWGAILAAVDRRLKAAVLMGTVPSLRSILIESDDADFVELRKTIPQVVLDRYLAAVAPLDGIHYVGHAAPTPLLFQFGRFERYVSETAMRGYANAASGPKTVRWYDTGHELNDPQALVDRAEWLKEHAGIPFIADNIGSLQAPPSRVP